jgi:hypothetical protein
LDRVSNLVFCKFNPRATGLSSEITDLIYHAT